MTLGMLLIENQSCVTSSCMELESYLRILSWSRYPPQFTETQRKVLRDISGLCWLQAGDETQKSSEGYQWTVLVTGWWRNTETLWGISVDCVGYRLVTKHKSCEGYQWTVLVTGWWRNTEKLWGISVDCVGYRLVTKHRKVVRDISGLCWLLQAGDETQKIAKFIPYRGKWSKRWISNWEDCGERVMWWWGMLGCPRKDWKDT